MNDCAMIVRTWFAFDWLISLTATGASTSLASTMKWWNPSALVIGILLWYNPVNDTLDAVSSPAERRKVQQIMAQLADYTLVKLSGSLVTEIQGVQPGANLDSFVRQAVRAYIATGRRRKLQQQLVKDYDALAAMYAELAVELADEVWLPVENAALLQTEKGLAA